MDCCYLYYFFHRVILLVSYFIKMLNHFFTIFRRQRRVSSIFVFHNKVININYPSIVYEYLVCFGIFFSFSELFAKKYYCFCYFHSYSLLSSVIILSISSLPFCTPCSNISSSRFVFSVCIGYLRKEMAVRVYAQENW